MEKYKPKEERLKDGHYSYAVQFKKLNETFEKLWQMKSTMRECIRDWLAALNVPPTMSENCANASSELIENCVKYTSEGSTVTVVISLNNSMLTVETINTAEERHRQALRKSIALLNTTSDPKQLFVETLQHPVEGKIHLGLIKIVMETEGQLECVLEQHADLAHVRLQIRMPEHQRPSDRKDSHI